MKRNAWTISLVGKAWIGSGCNAPDAHWLIRSGSIWELNILGFILSVVAAVLLIGTVEGFTHRRTA